MQLQARRDDGVHYPEAAEDIPADLRKGAQHELRLLGDQEEGIEGCRGGQGGRRPEAMREARRE